ncbi:putative DNA excision repair protein ERCC-8 [Coleophoma cylindrospora]|uniref:Putative DNA excision repair protein ERCC-8 n=1 Tax=Coleophoma cylindrospora TaxID=1849047 RepID=A0A3D8S1T1_9HELO|nr:putative DNA excision repair protein ERCC-8 [Coleophoma cylindrospora]
MNQLLLDRSAGNIGPQAFARLYTSQLVNAIQYAPKLGFDGGEKEVNLEDSDTNREASRVAADKKIWAHQSGVNALTIDRFEGRILLSGGVDASIKLWSLDEVSNASSAHTLHPTGNIKKDQPSAHKFGITHLSFYPFDSAAFLSSSYDHHLKLYGTETLQVAGSFDLSSIVYTHAVSPIASHLLVACATQHPAVRLVDLRTGASTHSLAGHHGALLAVAWNPHTEHILASGGIDGTIRLWDIRKSGGSLGVLNMEDSLGITGTDGCGTGARSREAGKSHQVAVNGITWTDDGSYIVSAGHDERIRVWDAATGANTLASFGPSPKNSHLSNLPLLPTPTTLTLPGQTLLFYPNEQEILVFELHEGRLLKRLKVPGPSIAAVRSRTGERNVRNRITALAWRGAADGFYSAHMDGQIRAWVPRTKDDDSLDKEEDEAYRKDEDESEGSKRKRKVLDDVFRDLTRQKISFG